MNLHNCKKILISGSITDKEANLALNAALFMGFHSVSAEFPIASADEGISISSLEELTDMYKNENANIPNDYVSSTKSAAKITDFDWRRKKGLEAIFGEGIFLEDKDNDLLPDCLNFKIKIPKNCDTSVLIAACNFAFRFGMETTAYDTNILADEDYKGNLLCFEGYGDCNITLEDIEDKKIVHVFGKGSELEEFSAFLCEKFPLLPDSNNWCELLKEITEAFSLASLDGQLAYIKTQNNSHDKVLAYVDPEIESKKDILKDEFKNVEFYNYKGVKKIYENEYDIMWEVDVFNKILKNEVYPLLKSNDTVEIFAALSEEKHVRDNLKAEIERSLNAYNVKTENLQIICAYKQGFSWIDEIVIPKLKKLSAKKVEIAFKPFLKEGQTGWMDEDGATPSYNVFESDSDKWFDLPIRALQELYPVEDIISKNTGIKREDIKFVKYEGNEDVTYRMCAFDENENEVLNDSYKAHYSERAYLDEFPMMGKVHPSTGHIRVLINGECKLDKRIATDVECIWDIFQTEVLSDCKKFVEEKFSQNAAYTNQPFFSQLRLEVLASEPDYKLESREDLISSLDALHEDMYFVASDFFKNYGIKITKEAFDAPGLILPVIKKSEGKPRFKVTLYDQMTDKPCVCIDKAYKNASYNKRQLEVYIDKLSYENKKLDVYISTSSADKDIVRHYVDLADKRLLSICDKFEHVNKIIFKVGNECFQTNVCEKSRIDKDLNIEDIDILENTLIGYEQYIEIIEKLKRVPKISVYKIAKSYQGRDIYAIELLPNTKGYISRTKRINYFPSQLINCRHHANEVSSTNAAFMVLRELLTDEKYKNCADKLNLVIVPVENVDGTAIHYELQKDNPNWKFHVARFNSIGKEFFYDHFKDDTIHKEAEGIKNLYRSFLPDLIVDNHGVPSHEWEQQFSGYTSPSFKGFWLPRSILYGYFWTVPEEEFKSNLVLAKAIEDAVAVAIGNDEEMTSWNLEWSERFEKFAHQWMPKLFPANYYKNMINYWISRKHDLTQKYASHRFPWITTTYYTSEVADETAQGDYLNLCARAHLTHNLAIIELMQECKCVYESKLEVTNSNVSICCTRQRPVLV